MGDTKVERTKGSATLPWNDDVEPPWKAAAAAKQAIDLLIAFTFNSIVPPGAI